MNIVFMGTPDFSVAFLKKVIEEGHEVKAVVTQPDRPKGRGQKLMPPPIKTSAVELGIPVLQPESLSDDDFCKDLASYNADLFVVVAFSILPKKVLAIPKIGSVNVHGSLLPRYRGAAPVQWAVVNGDKESGVTVFLLDEKMDHGPVLEMMSCPVGEDDTSEDLFNRIMELGCIALGSALKKIESKNYTPIDQNHSAATPARKLKKEDGLIDLNMSTDVIYNKIRGFYPYPICYSYLNDKMFRIIRARKNTQNLDFLSKGELYFNECKDLFLKTADGVIQIFELQLEGKRAMNPIDFYNGLQSREGLLLRSN
jgi:methionyl-tRNA formyltransferase